MALLTDYWPLALLAALVALLLLYLLLSRRQRVTLSDNAPVRPHMVEKAKSSLGANDIGSSTNIISATTEAGVRKQEFQPLHHDAGPPDDLVKLKGIGPKLAAVLNDYGLTRFDQIAKLSPAQVSDLDESLGAFRGRLTRDHVVDQADYLARGDIDGFEQRFGKL